MNQIINTQLTFSPAWEVLLAPHPLAQFSHVDYEYDPYIQYLNHFFCA